MAPDGQPDAERKAWKAAQLEKQRQLERKRDKDLGLDSE